MKKPSYTSYDYKPVTVVPVIASFDTEGHIAPLYVRIEGESYKVNSYWVKSECTNIIQYNCKIIDQECLKPILLSFYQDETVWTIPE